MAREYIPKPYDFVNMYNSQFSPSTVHVNNTGLAWYFKKYLLQKLISVFEFKGLPEEWAMNYFTYTLFLWGFIAIVDTDKYGVIPQHCGLGGGLNVMYQPRTVIISNPLIRPFEAVIDKDCALVKMQPDYCGAWDIISYYGDLLALASETASVNLVNSKYSYVFVAESQSQADSFKKLYDEIASGNPAVFADKNLFQEDGKPNWMQFDQNLAQNYIVGDLMADMHRIVNMFNTDIGIPNANYEKSERLITDEVNANNIDTMSKVALWLETIRKGLNKANELYGLNMSVNLRFETEYDGNTDDEEIGGIK